MIRCTSIFALLLLCGCQIWQDVTVVRVDGLSDLAISFDGMQGQVQVLVQNPNGFNIKAHEVDVDVFVEEDRIGTVTLPGNQILKARAESMLVLDIKSDPGSLKKIFQNQFLQVMGGSPIEIRTVGTVRGKAFGLSIAIPIESSEEINL